MLSLLIFVIISLARCQTFNSKPSISPPPRLPAGRGVNKAFLLDPPVSHRPALCLQPWARYIGIFALPLLRTGRGSLPRSTPLQPGLFLPPSPSLKLLRPTPDQASGPHHAVPSISRSEPCARVFWGHQEIGYDGATSQCISQAMAQQQQS